MFQVMQPAKAVKPMEPSEIEFKLADPSPDNLSDEERAKLHEALKKSYAQAKAGMWIPADEVLSKLRARR